MNLNEPKLISKRQLYVNINVVPFYWHVNHGKLCLLNNMDIEKSK
jgi:hypothetical protein